MKTTFLLFTLLTQVITGLCQATTDVKTEDLERKSQQLDMMLGKHISTNADPGLAISIIKNGQVIYKRSKGRADLNTGEPLTSKTPIYIASVAKEFTAVSIMMLEENGKLSYDDKLTKYFPEFASFAGEINIRHILTHTSGLLDHLDAMKENVSGWTNSDVVDLLKRENKLLFSPGEKVSYSNSGYVLLSMIVEKVSGKSFPVFLKERILEPLGMKNTFVAQKGTKLPDHAKGYIRAEGKWTVSDYDAFTTGSGGIYSTLDDMEKWDGALNSERILRPASLELASTANKLNSGRLTAWGFGWLAEFAAKGDLANVWYTAAFGDFKGFKAMHKRIPARRLTVLILSNQGEFPWDILEKAQQLFAG